MKTGRATWPEHALFRSFMLEIMECVSVLFRWIDRSECLALQTEARPACTAWRNPKRENKPSTSGSTDVSDEDPTRTCAYKPYEAPRD